MKQYQATTKRPFIKKNNTYKLTKLDTLQKKGPAMPFVKQKVTTQTNSHAQEKHSQLTVNNLFLMVFIIRFCLIGWLQM